MFFLLCIASLINSVVLADELDLDDHWEKFKVAFNKEYESEDHEDDSQEHWEKKVVSIVMHNVEADMGDHDYKLEVNSFTDMPREEFKRTKLGLKLPQNETKNYAPVGERRVSERAAPDTLDWRDEGCVTDVKDQGDCGSCWSYSVAGAVEGAVCMDDGDVVSLSQQQLVDCSKSYDTDGCDGGWPSDALKYVKDKGLQSYKDYPPKFKEDKCRYTKSRVVAKISGSYDVPKNEKTLKQYLYDYGPISVCINVPEKMESYSSGVFSDKNCKGDVDHAVLLVGYGTDQETGKDYWLIKNSWGPDWGENGYIRIRRNYNNMCSVANYAVYGVV